MKFGLLFLIGGGIATAAAAPHRYDTIIERNAFGLNDPPPLTPTIRSASLEKLKLTGLASMTARKQAFLMKTSPGRQPEYFNLYEGESEGDLEVLAIDLQGETVHLRHQGSHLVLSFVRSGMGSDPVAEMSNPRAGQSVHATLAPIPP